MNTQTIFGFITVMDVPDLGHCGGLLIVSSIGRPLEFHCSAPVATNRAQQILYGRTYESFLYCEQIGLALIEKAKSQPHLLISNVPPLLSLQQLVEIPVVLLAGDESAERVASTPAAEHAQEVSEVGVLTNQPPIGTAFEARQEQFWTLTTDAQSIQATQRLIATFTDTLTFDEPFERIEKAIEEAQAVAR